MDVVEALRRAGAAAVSDALGRRGAIIGVQRITGRGVIAGPAYTVMVPPGDWGLVVEAIARAPRGSVLVVNAGGPLEEPRAVWGGLASLNALTRGLAATVVYGYVRDTSDIRGLGYTVYASGVTPRAGDPRGEGAIEVTLKLPGAQVRPGDIVVGDDDGVVVVPAEDAEEVAEKARAIVEAEEEIAGRLRAGANLSEILREYGIG